MVTLHPEQNARIIWEIQRDGSRCRLNKYRVRIWIMDDRGVAVPVKFRTIGNEYHFIHLASEHPRPGIYTLVLLVEQDADDNEPRIVQAYGAYQVADKMAGPVPPIATIDLVSNIPK